MLDLIGPAASRDAIAPPPLKVGTRGSPLALFQARLFMTLARERCPLLRDGHALEEHRISTSGDLVQDRRLADIGGKGLFAKEIHEALLDGRVDLAVHSLKDLETEVPPGVVLACTLPREDPRDALVLRPGLGPAADAAADPWGAIPMGAVVGTSSARRQAQLLHRRPDLRVEPLRGNVHTRLGKVRAGDGPGASLLALAGLRRLGLEDEAALVLDLEAMVPAACQGIIGITVRADDTELRELLAAIDDREARAAASAERALLAALDGSCRTPVGGHARLLPEGGLLLTGLVARADGSFLLRRTISGRRSDAARLGAELGRSLRAASPADVVA